MAIILRRGRESLNLKTALAAGVVEGLGYVIAEKLLKKGAEFFINDINAEKLKHAKGLLSGSSEKIFLHACDIKDKNSVKFMFEYICLKNKKIDILINNAGIISDSFFHKMSGNAFDKIIKVNYLAFKAAIIGFTKSLALENTVKVITANAVVPGFINSDMTTKIPSEEMEKIILKIPMHKFGEPKDVSGIVCFLVGDEDKYIIGQVISVNGGYLI
jgi:3-oxoacyl-[acyl-carrier protein] reductase